MPLLLLLAIACGVSDPPEPPADPTAAIEAVQFSLNEAARLDAEDRPAEAHAAWLDALVVFEAQIEPWVRHHHGEKTTVRLEYGFSRMRHEMTAGRGRPASQAADLGHALADVAPRPEAPVLADAEND